MIKGVIFDLDGVLVSTDELHYQAWRWLAEQLGLPEFTRADNERLRGISRMASLDIVLEKSDNTYTQEQKETLADRKNEYYKRLLRALTPDSTLPGAVRTLQLLHEKGIKTAVGSASANAPVILEQTGLLPYLDAVSSGLDTKKSKPDPEVFLIAADKLSLAPEDCLVAEDALAGIQAAHAGGMKGLAVGPLCAEIGGDYAARDLSQVEDWDKLLA